MVSFQCEACGDVFTKKKLDGHRAKCRNASFVCLDCMTHFAGTQYREHTSCITEDQKYQGALHKDKSSKQNKKPDNISAIDSESKKPRKAYVEDAPESGEPTTTKKSITIVEPPSEAQPPPPAEASQPQAPVSVFDFLVPGDTPNASKTSLLEPPQSAKKMDGYSPSVNASEFSLAPNSVLTKPDPDYEKQGWSYGSEPIPKTQRRERPKVEYFTPAPKDLQRDLEEARRARESGQSTDKKRKRPVSEIDIITARSTSHDSDAIMSDAPAALGLHTGLTGGLDRMLSRTHRHKHDDQPSPMDRERSRKPTQTYIVAKEQTRSKPGSSAASTSASTSLVKVKKRRTSDEGRPRKHHRSHRTDPSSSAQEHHHRDRDREREGDRSRSKSRSGMKAIEYHRSHSAGGGSEYETDRSMPDHNDDDDNTTTTGTAAAKTRQQLVLYRSRAELFMSFVTKGPESESGYSLNKALKRYHREREAGGYSGGGGDRHLRAREEEKELFKGLRLKKNERGEVVVFF